jgi:hypothetical protein
MIRAEGVRISGGALMILLLGACASKPVPHTAMTIDTLPDGAVHVANAGPSAWSDTNGWTLVLERTIHPAAGNPGELMQPGSVVVSSAGDVFVLDRKPAVIKHFAADGHLVGTIGRQGQGPGEFGDYGILYIVNDTLVHQDAGQSRASVFATDGRFLSSWISEPIAMTDLAADDSGRIPMEAPTGTHNINAGHLVARYHADGRVVDTVWYPPAPDPSAWRIKTAHADMGVVVPFTPDRGSAFDRAGRLISGDEGAYRLVYSRTGNDMVRVIDAPATRVRIPDSARESAFTTLTTKYPWLLSAAHFSDIPLDYPVWSALVADGANDLWVLRPGPRGPGDHWDVFDADGRLLGAVPAPFDRADDTFWTRDHVYVMQDADDGTPAVFVYRISRRRQ